MLALASSGRAEGFGKGEIVEVELLIEHLIRLRRSDFVREKIEDMVADLIAELRHRLDLAMPITL